jgi:hypothetical protein
MDTVTDAIGTSLPLHTVAIALAGFRRCRISNKHMSELTERQRLKDAKARGEGIALTVAQWQNAVLNNALGRYGDAVAAARRAAEEPEFGGVSNWATAELVEAAVRSGATETAADAFARLRAATSASGTDWALGIEARARALISDGAEADRAYREAIDGSAGPGCARNSPVRIWSMGNGCAENAAAPKHGRSCTPRTTCSM